MHKLRHQSVKEKGIIEHKIFGIENWSPDYGAIYSNGNVVQHINSFHSTQ